ncbi:MAG: HDIG domain-containing protein [Chloroflexi bacterium]|nr:HDIG domain-containing protein [Chloroflexota bacterium]
MAAVLWAAWALAVLLPDQQAAGLAVGRASPRDIKASSQVTYVSDVETRLARDEAALLVPVVYTLPDPSVGRAQLERLAEIQETVSEARERADLTSEARIALLMELPEFDADDPAWESMLTLSASTWEMLCEESVRVLSLILGSEVRPTDLSRARLDIQRLMAYTLTLRDRNVITAMLFDLVVPNTFLDTEATEAKRSQAREQVQPVVRTIVTGEAIVREGEIITDEIYEQLHVLGLANVQVRWQKQVANLGIGLLIVLVMVFYTTKVHPELIDHPRQQLLLVLTLAAVTLAARLLVPGHLILPYIVPSAAAAMLIALFLNIQYATLVSMVAAVTISFIGNGSLDLTVYVLLGSLVGSLALMRTEQLNAFFRAAVALTIANVAVLLLSSIRGESYDTLGLLQLAGTGALSAVLASMVCLVAYVFTGRLFGVTTALHLMELARPTHPLFRQLLIKAPGTYHHSILISNMAERAAEAIGADSLLTRVGSYYHDVGKTLRPYFFTENQTDGQNPHDSLDPQTSAEIIIGHTSEGMELAKRYRLPEKVAAFIPEHHGTTLAAYFYRRAAQAYDGDGEMDDSAFRYPGPKPQSKETAIVMLADAVEAWSRANRPSTQAEMDRLIRQVITDRLISGQLDETDLTLRDLDRIRQAFASILTGVYHPRIQYPERMQTRGG